MEEDAKGGPAPARRGLTLDPAAVNRLLLIAVLGVVILILGVVGYALYAGVLRPKAPRTAVERQISALELAVRSQPNSAVVWTDYVKALTVAEQYSKAEQAVRDGMKALDDDSQLLALRASLEHLQGRDDAALATAAEAVKVAVAYRDKSREASSEKGMSANWFAMGSIIDAELVRAEIDMSRGQYQKAIDSYTTALKEDAQMADVLGMRGDAYMKLGNLEAARKDYAEALRYDPTNKAASDGLKKAGGTQ